MTVDAFKPNELIDIANLARTVEKFNRDQMGDKKLFAEVTFYRDGGDVASLIEAAVHLDTASAGDLVFEVKEKK